MGSLRGPVTCLSPHKTLDTWSGYNKPRIYSVTIFNSFFFFFLFLPHHVACRILVPRLRGLNPGPPAVRVWSPNHWPTREFPKILFCYKKFQEHIKESCIPTTPHTQHSNSVTTYIYHPVSVLCIKPSFFFSFFSKGFFFFNIVFIIMITSLESQRQRPWE